VEVWEFENKGSPKKMKSSMYGIVFFIAKLF
jgi:hypothetical protein